MSTTLVCIFDTLSNAEEARRQLLDSGLSLSSVDILSRDDEAGGTAGNFVSGNSDKTRRLSKRKKRGSSVGGEDQTYAADFRSVVKRATVMLTVEAEDDMDTGKARDLITRLGGTDIDSRTSPYH